MMTDHFYCKDHPEFGEKGKRRVPQPGEHAYTFTFPLNNGNEIKIHCGRETLEKFSDFLGSLMIDEEAERPSV